MNANAPLLEINSITDYVGSRIKFFRKLNKLSISELAAMIHKSKSTLSKYENGLITIDIESLYDIAHALHINLEQLIDYREEQTLSQSTDLNTFFSKNGLYIYYYDGRKKEIIKSYLLIQSNNTKNVIGCTFYMDIPSFEQYEECDFYYIGEINSFDLVTYATLINQTNPMERLGFCILNPFHHNTSTWGMMFGISYKPIAPFSLKFLISTTPVKTSELGLDILSFTKNEIKMMKNLNMMLLNQ